MYSVIKERYKKDINFFKLIISTILGIALGAAWMTSIRFNRFGLSEIFYLIFVIILAFRYINYFFKIKNNLINYAKFFLFIIFFIVSYKTLFIRNNAALPENLIIYYISFFLFFFTLIVLKKKIIDLNFVSLIFTIIFLYTLFFSLFVEDIIYKSKIYINTEFFGLANNPNQICFYLLSLLFFLSFCNKYIFFYFFLVLFFLSLYFKSNAFLLASISMALSFLFLHLVNFFYKKKTAMIFFLFLMCLIIFMFLNYNQIITFAIKYFDGTETRLILIKNGIYSILHSPFFGNGVGSFSGHQGPFEGYEIHNIFLDFASQFGIPFSLLVCGVMLMSLYLMIVNNNFLSAVSLLGLLIFLNFHYFGRHFIFYVILAILYNYIVNCYKKFFLFKSKGNF